MRFVIGLGIISGVLLGCATTLPTRELSSTVRQQIHSIAILQVAEPQEVSVINSGGAAIPFMMTGAVGGAIGGAITGASASDHTKQYFQQLTAAKIEFGSTMDNALRSDMGGSRFVISQVEHPPVAPDDHDHAFDIRTVSTEADAVLDVWFSNRFGYFSEWNSLDYKPVVVVRARLTMRSTRESVYSKTMSCGVRLPSADNHLPSGDSYRYRSFEQLISRAPASARGLQECERKIADELVRELTNDTTQKRTFASSMGAKPNDADSETSAAHVAVATNAGVPRRQSSALRLE